MCAAVAVFTTVRWIHHSSGSIDVVHTTVRIQYSVLMLLAPLAVAMVMAGLEARFDIVIEDDEVSAQTLETLGSLVSFIEQKIAA